MEQEHLVIDKQLGGASVSVDLREEPSDGKWFYFSILLIVFIALLQIMREMEKTKKRKLKKLKKIITE